MFWRDLLTRQGLLPLKSAPSFLAGRAEAGFTKRGECSQVLQRNTINCVYRTYIIEPSSYLLHCVFNPLQLSGSADLVSVLSY